MGSGIGWKSPEAIHDLARGIAHEFNNLHAAILGFAELAGLQVQPEHPVQARLSRIIEAGRRATALVELLNVFGECKPQIPRRFDFNRLVRDFDPVHEGVPVNDLRIVTRIDSKPLWVFSDSERIRVVLKNLVLDARNSLSVGRRLILATGRVPVETMRIRGITNPGGRPCAAISIMDTGKFTSGYPRQAHKDLSLSKSEYGADPELVLSMAHDIIRRCGGVLDVQCRLGGKATVRVILPLLPSPQPEERTRHV
jgi:signal transduction histidine kinase